MQHFFVFIALPNNWPIKSKSLPTFVHPFVRHSIPPPPTVPQFLSLAIACQANILWAFACRLCCWTWPTNVAKVLRSAVVELQLVTCFMQILQFFRGRGRHSHVLRFMLYIFDFAFACKNSIAHFWALTW